MESMAIDPEAISLANTVTARPPGISSIYYNPAGLSLMPEGTYISLGLIPVLIKSDVKFTTDPNFNKFHDAQGNEINDPFNGQEDSLKSGRMYLPILNEGTDMPALTVPVLGFSYREPNQIGRLVTAFYVPYGGGWSNDNGSAAGF